MHFLNFNFDSLYDLQLFTFRPNLFHTLGKATVGKQSRLFILGIFAFKFLTLCEFRDWKTSLKDKGNLLFRNLETKPAIFEFRISSYLRTFNLENKGSQWALNLIWIVLNQ